MSVQDSMMEMALRYAARGWDVFPCHTPGADGACSCANPGCENQGKHPRVAWKAKATTNAATIKNWWHQWPDANIGIATGERSGIIVLDIDGGEGKATVDGKGGIVPGPCVTTGRGEHRYLTHPGFPVKNFVKRDSLDLRGDGGYVIAPPSLHGNGKRYEWINATEELPPAPIPVWLQDMLKEPQEPAVITTGTVPSSARTLAYASVALEKELVRISESVNGTRNKQLNESALKMGHIVGAGWLDSSVVANALLTAAIQKGLPRHEAQATIKSGMTAGMKEPAVLEDRPADPYDPKYGLKISDKRKISKGEQAVDPSPAEVHWMERLADAADYPFKTFAPLNWAVPGLLPEGCFLFAGAPKTGKSWVALQIALAVATGGLLFGKIQVPQAPVLYLDLESNQRRMKSRLSAMIGEDGVWPERGMLRITNDIDRLPDLIDRLDEYMVKTPDTRMIVIDIFENVRPDDMNVRNANLYRLDYNAIRLLTRWADAYHVTILMLHHTNKTHSPDNQFNRISGSTGLTGATSGAWVMGGTEKDEYVLKVQGRDLENSDDLLLKWDSFLCRHLLLGNGALYSISDERKAILDVMDNDEEWTPRELADEMNKPVKSVDKLLRALVADRLVEKAGYGKYIKVRQRITYGLDISDGRSGRSGENVDRDAINSDANSYRSASTPTDQPQLLPGGGRSYFASQSPKTPEDANSYRSYRFNIGGNLDSHTIKGETDVEHDVRREQEVMKRISKGDLRGARRVALHIRSSPDRERVERLIDEHEQSGGWSSVEGY